MGVVGMQRLRDTEIEIESSQQQHQRNTASSTRQPWKKGGQPAALQQTSDEEAKRLNVDSD